MGPQAQTSGNTTGNSLGTIMAWVVYWHWDDEVHWYEGSEADVMGKYHSIGDISKIVVASQSLKHASMMNQYGTMCIGTAIEHGRLPIKNGHFVVWHLDDEGRCAWYGDAVAGGINTESCQIGAAKLCYLVGNTCAGTQPTNSGSGPPWVQCTHETWSLRRQETCPSEWPYLTPHGPCPIGWHR